MRAGKTLMTLELEKNMLVYICSCSKVPKKMLIDCLFFESNRAQEIRTTTITKSPFKIYLPIEYYVEKLTDKTLEVEELQKRIQALEDQLTSATAPTCQNNVENGDLIAQRLKFSGLYENRAESNDEISDHQNNQGDHSFGADQLMAEAETTVNSNKRRRENDDDSNVIATKKRVIQSTFETQNAVITQDSENVTKHTGEKQFQCSCCSKHFSRLDELKWHMRTHGKSRKKLQSGKKSHQCNRCNKCFAYKHHLRRHMKVHRDELIIKII